MNDPARRPDDGLDALFALARTHRPEPPAAEFAFETRLLARLRAHRNAQDEANSIWATVSWRLVPFFAACVVALALWHSQVVTETDDAEQMAYVENSAPPDSWANLN